jgi:hypothetical protein
MSVSTSDGTPYRSVAAANAVHTRPAVTSAPARTAATPSYSGDLRVRLLHRRLSRTSSDEAPSTQTPLPKTGRPAFKAIADRCPSRGPPQVGPHVRSHSHPAHRPRSPAVDQRRPHRRAAWHLILRKQPRGAGPEPLAWPSTHRESTRAARSSILRPQQAPSLCSMTPHPNTETRWHWQPPPGRPFGRAGWLSKKPILCWNSWEWPSHPAARHLPVS